MVGARTLWGKQNYPLAVAFIAALALHFVLFSVLNPNFKSHLAAKPKAAKPITIQLAKPQIEELEKEQTEAIKPAQKAPQTLTPIKEPVTDTKEEPRHSLPTVVFSGSAVQEWLQQETVQHLNKNPQKLQSFEKTFVAIVKEIPDDDRLEDISPLATGINVTTINGKRCRQLRMVMPYNDDWARDIVTSMGGCTPVKNFEFKMR